jgi:cell division septation protein DedD
VDDQVNRKQFIVAAALAALASPALAQTVKSGIAAWEAKDYDGAVGIWRPLAEKGDADAQFDLGQAYRLGKGVPIDLAAAQTWLERAADQGHVDAQTTLGLLLFQSGNRIGGIRWLKTAADKNDPRAMLVYGTALFNGDGTPQNSALGYAYVSRSAAQGLAAAKDTQAQMDEVVSADDRRKAASLLADAKPAPKPEARTRAKAPAPTTKPKPDKIAAAKPLSMSGVKPAPAPVRTPLPASATAPAASGNWRVQLGAFSQRSSAEALFRKLAGSGALAGRSPAYVAAGPVVRLQVGPFKSKAAASAACRELSARGQACFPVPAS